MPRLGQKGNVKPRQLDEAVSRQFEVESCPVSSHAVDPGRRSGTGPDHREADLTRPLAEMSEIRTSKMSSAMHAPVLATFPVFRSHEPDSKLLCLLDHGRLMAGPCSLK